VSGKNEAVTCWSEAEIPSEAKRKRGTLKPSLVVTNLFLLRAAALHKLELLAVLCEGFPALKQPDEQVNSHA
jgi:hypothetical protein